MLACAQSHVYSTLQSEALSHTHTLVQIHTLKKGSAMTMPPLSLLTGESQLKDWGISLLSTSCHLPMLRRSCQLCTDMTAVLSPTGTSTGRANERFQRNRLHDVDGLLWEELCHSPKREQQRASRPYLNFLILHVLTDNLNFNHSLAIKAATSLQRSKNDTNPWRMLMREIKQTMRENNKKRQAYIFFPRWHYRPRVRACWGVV